MTGDAFLIVRSTFYADIAGMLTEGATTALAASGRAWDTVEVPGAFEIPGAIAQAARGAGFAGYIALGCVIRGETTHYDYICSESARGLMSLATRDRLAIGYGILTCETRAQAVERADPEQGNKGADAASAALALAALGDRFAAS